MNNDDRVFEEYEELEIVQEFLRLERIGKKVAEAFGLSGEVEVKSIKV